MIVCICNCLSEADCERAAATRGCDVASDVHEALGAAICCGRCVPTVEAIIDEVRFRREAARAAEEQAVEAVD